MDAIEKLNAHHRKLIGTIRDLVERSKEDPADTSLLLTYCNEYLISHAEAEEVTLYTANNDRDFAGKLTREHKEIKQSLDVIDTSFAGGRARDLAQEADAFIALLNRHFEGEERILMPKIKMKMSEEELEALIAEVHEIEAEKNKADLWSLFENDHRRIDLNISRVLNSAGNPNDFKRHFEKARTQLLKHIELEEGELFPAFGTYATPEQKGPVKVMIMEHTDIKSFILTPDGPVKPQEKLHDIEELTGRLAVHNKKEELVLYPMINRSIPRRERFEIFRKCYEELKGV